MKSRVAHLALAGLLVFIAACSDGGGNATSTDPSGSAPASIEAGVDVPAGVNWAASSLTPATDSATPVPSFEQVTATAGVPPAPAGYPFRQSDYIRNAFVVGDVQLATGTCGCWQGGDSSGVFGGLRTPVYLFRSVDDGATWAQVDLAGVLGDVNGQINSIIERDGAMIMTATTSDATGATPTVINVLRSTDGASWERLSTIASDAATPVSIEAFRLYALGSSLVLYGGDMACQFTGSNALQNIGPAYQSRLWTSTDGGATWAAQLSADIGFDAGQPPLPDAAACAGLGIQDILDKFASGPRQIELLGDLLAVWSADGERIVTSADGTAWSASTLEGATAKPSEQVTEPEVNSTASAIVSVGGQFVAMNLEDFRNADDTATGSSVGLSVVTWTSADGKSWERQPLGRPILVTEFSASYQFFVADGRLGLRVFDRVEDLEFGVYESVAGVSEDWTKCVAAPGVNCAFSTELIGIEPGADLSGSDLSYASLEGRDLTDVSFAGARLRGANLVGATFSRTNFDGAELSYVTLVGDLSTSTFAGATLTSIQFDDGFLTTPPKGATIASPRIIIAESGLPVGVSMTGRDLSGFSFSNGTLAGVDFSGADLTNASFSYTDLTGAKFTGATIDGVFFFEVTCPDGKPASDTGSGPERCRL